MCKCCCLLWLAAVKFCEKLSQVGGKTCDPGNPCGICLSCDLLSVEVVRVYLPFGCHTHVRCRFKQNLYSAQVGVKIDNTKNVKTSFNICNYYNLVFSIEMIIIISSSLLFPWISLSFIPNHLLVTTELYYRVNKNGNMGGNVVTWVTCRLICQVMVI